MIRPISLAAGLLTTLMVLLSGEFLLGGDNPEDTETAPEAIQLMNSGLALSGDKEDDGNGPVSPQAGTEWRLVSFLSMDDAIGEIRPKDPSLFTMHLHPDGTAFMRLGCNCVSGTWSDESAGDGASGRFAFGHLVFTRVMCPPSHLDERIVADAEFVRGYLLRESRPYLNLMADGGIYEWEPLEAPVPGK